MGPLSWSNIYTHHAEEYDLLVAHEDYQHNLAGVIEQLQPLQGAVAVEFGAGTGRVTSLLAGRVRALHAFDLNLPMLRLARHKRRMFSWQNVSLSLADSRAAPFADHAADFAIQGWAFLHIAVWHPADWVVQLGRALDEMRRVVRPGGRMILIETLGTGEEQPRVPPEFRRVYDWLEQERGFRVRDLRTDYRFDDLDQVERVVVPLFGEKMRDRLSRDGQGFRLPECTGVWWQEIPPDDSQPTR